MKCPQCGAQVDGDFCPYCGAASQTVTPKTEETLNANTPQQPQNTAKSKKPIYKKWWFWVIAAIVIFGMIGKLGSKNKSSVDISEFEWGNLALAKMLPEPESNLGSNLINTEDYLSINVHEMSKDAYKKYVNGCREKGFTVKLSEYDGYYSASNEAEFELMLYYFDDENKMSIDLTAPSKSSDDDENTSEEVKSEVTEKSIIDTFVESFNELSETPITNRVKFDPKDKENGHYRTEYRLSAWDGSVGETAFIGKLDIDIVNYGSHGGYYENEDLRVYISADTTEEIIAIFPIVAKAMDSTVTDEEIQEVIDHVNEWGDKNGLLIGELSGYILSHQHYSDLMLDLS